MHLAQVVVAGEQHECTAPRPLQDLDHFAPGRRDELRRSRVRHFPGQVENRLTPVVEFRGELDLVRRRDPEPPAHVLERTVDAHRRGGQDSPLHAIEQQLSDYLGYVDGRAAQEDPASPYLEVIDESGVVRAGQEPEILAKVGSAAAEREHVLRQVLRQRDRGLDGFQGVEEAACFVRRALEKRGRDPDAALGAGAGIEAQHLQRAEEQPRMIAHVLDVALQVVRAVRIRDKLRGNGPIDVTRQIVEPIVADRNAEVLRGDVFELVRFVDDGVVARRNHLAEAALSHRRVRAQQMMVDDDEVGFSGALPHARDEAVIEARALAPQAVLAGGRDLRPERKILGQVIHLGAIAGLGLARPVVDHLDRDGILARSDRRAVAQRVELVQAEIIATSFHVRGGERYAKRVAENREVLEEDLLLQVLRAGRDENPVAAENRGDQIRERLASAGTRLGEEDAAVREHVRYRGGHGELRWTRFESLERSRQRAPWREDGVHGRVKRCAVGTGGYASGYRGNFRHRASTSVFTRPSAASSSGDVSARVINSAIRSISGSRMPRLVTAGVPMRMPLATIGGFSSNGMAFLLTVMAALPSAASAALPVMPRENTLTSIR